MTTIVGSDILATKLVTVVDHEITGLAARTARQQARLSLREVARRMGVSAAYVCDLENGRRTWDMARACRYAAAVGANAEAHGRREATYPKPAGTGTVGADVRPCEFTGMTNCDACPATKCVYEPDDG